MEKLCCGEHMKLVKLHFYWEMRVGGGGLNAGINDKVKFLQWSFTRPYEDAAA